MEFKLTIFAIIIFSLVIISAGVIINEQATKYSSSASSDLADDFNKLDDISGSAETWQGNINPQSGEASSDYESETFRGGYGIITSIFAPLRVVFGSDGIIQSAGERFGIPTYVIKTLIVMFSIAITFGIVAIVFRLSRSAA